VAVPSLLRRSARPLPSRCCPLTDAVSSVVFGCSPIDGVWLYSVAFLEYSLYKWKKTVKVFFEELAKPKAGGEALAKAVAAYRAVLAAREARAAKMAALEADSKKGGVAGNKARMELEQMKTEDQTGMNKSELTAAAAKRKAEREGGPDPYELEKAKLAAEKKVRSPNSLRLRCR
jgi:hypothetical protein